MKTLELKRMEGMEDITNFFAGVTSSATDEALENDGNAAVFDRKKLEIIRKLNFRAKDPATVFRHRRSQRSLAGTMYSSQADTNNNYNTT